MPFLIRQSSLLLLAIAGFFLSQLFKDPEFIEARDFKIRSLGLKSSTVSADLVYYNPNNFGLKLKNADLDVYLDDRFVGHSVVDTLIDIPARDSFALPVKLDVEMKNLLPNALSILTQHEIMLGIKGKARIGKGGIFLNIPVNYQGRQEINMFKP
jgi:LEA14-like dessication related protein